MYSRYSLLASLKEKKTTPFISPTQSPYFNWKYINTGKENTFNDLMGSLILLNSLFLLFFHLYSVKCVAWWTVIERLRQKKQWKLVDKFVMGLINSHTHAQTHKIMYPVWHSFLDLTERCSNSFFQSKLYYQISPEDSMLYCLTFEFLSCRVCLVLKARLVHLERKWVNKSCSPQKPSSLLLQAAFFCPNPINDSTDSSVSEL